MSNSEIAALQFKEALQTKAFKLGISRSEVLDIVETQKQKTQSQISNYWNSRGRLVLSSGKTVRIK